MDDPLATQRRQAVAHDGDPRLHPGLHRSGRPDRLVDRPPPLEADAPLELFEHLAGQQARKPGTLSTDLTTVRIDVVHEEVREVFGEFGWHLARGGL